MIDFDYYKNYKGPHLILAQIWKIEDKKEDITDYIKTFYGEENNWKGKLYTYKDIFPDKDSKYKFYVEFLSNNGRKHWFHGFVGEQNQFFNPPLHTPMNQQE